MVDQSTEPSPSLVTVSNVKKYFPVNSGGIRRRNATYVHAVDDVSFTIERGETLGLVGKAAPARALLGGASSNCISRLKDRSNLTASNSAPSATKRCGRCAGA